MLSKQHPAVHPARWHDFSGRQLKASLVVALMASGLMACATSEIETEPEPTATLAEVERSATVDSAQAGPIGTEGFSSPVDSVEDTHSVSREEDELSIVKNYEFENAPRGTNPERITLQEQAEEALDAADAKLDALTAEGWNSAVEERVALTQQANDVTALRDQLEKELKEYLASDEDNLPRQADDVARAIRDLRGQLQSNEG